MDEKSYGWVAKGDRKLSEIRNPYFPMSPTMMKDILPFLWRYIPYWANFWKKPDELFIDVIRPLWLNPNYANKHFLINVYYFSIFFAFFGVPCGALGTGSLGRDFRGGFCKFSLRPGLVEHNVSIVPADQFILTIRKQDKTVYQQVLCSADTPSDTLSSWSFNFAPENISYRGLFPRSWTTFHVPFHGVTLVCKQVSPVIPHDYQESSLPVSVFVWEIHNNSDEEMSVSLTFTFRNGTGDPRWDSEGNCHVDSISFDSQEKPIKGLSLTHSIAEMPCVYSIAALEKENQKVTCQPFDPSGSGGSIWQNLLHNGKLVSVKTAKSKELGIAVCVQTTVKPGQAKEVEFSLAWDMPIVWFPGKKRQYRRRYTKWYGTSLVAGPKICQHALEDHWKWEDSIDSWQKPILENEFLPSWYKSALFNELYFLVDGGSVWFETEDSWKDQEPHLSDHTLVVMGDYGRFAYLESWEYRLFTTYDVHFYASFALAMLWPKLEHSMQAEFSDQVQHIIDKKYKSFYDGDISLLKRAPRLPHDLGNPASEPWLSVNGYLMHDTGEWKDLNLKFVLQTYRDYLHVVDEDMKRNFLERAWPSIKALMQVGLDKWDVDNDGMIENSGTADQTYDTWRMHGTSAYCGSLWLGALGASIFMAQAVNDLDTANMYVEVLEHASKSFNEKLWTGSYYKFDEFSTNHDTIMAGQLCGHWYLSACKGNAVADILPRDRTDMALRTMYQSNVLGFGNGAMGIVNGRKPNGSRDVISSQADEMWTGVAYAVAANMIQQGMIKEGFQTAWGSYRACFEQLGMQYQTPEAIFEQHNYRALGYMRPLAIWAIQWVLEKQYHFPHLNAHLFVGLKK